MKKVLVSGASGIVGYGILRSLSGSGRQLGLIGTSIYGDSAAQAFCGIFERAPPTGDPGYVDWLLATIRKHQVDLIVPGIEVDMHKWIEHVPDIERSGAVAVLNDAALIRLCGDKWAFYEKLREAGLDCAIESTLCAEFESLQREYGLPFLLKPRRGFGSKGIVKIDGANTFAQHQRHLGQTLIAQPIVGDDDEEYTSSAFGDGRGGFHASMTLRRRLSKDGFTEKAEVVSTDELMEPISDLCNLFRPIGPTNFQFRKCADGYKLLEINPRISSSTSIRTAFGYNESAMAVDYFLGHQTPTQPDIRRGRAVRYTDEVIFYEDGVHL
jgi:carbamoyl-phosphate synthase large subunit